MKKKRYQLLLLPLFLLFVPMIVHADTSYGSSDWSVVFTADKKMECTFRTADLDEIIYKMQPGDNAILTLNLKNENSVDTDWYMSNKILHSLEDQSLTAKTAGGAYTYILTYKGKDGAVKTLFSSEMVGGDVVSQAGEGLHEATDALEDYFYLDTLSSNQRSSITLEIALEGETQGNAYQNTMADLQMTFAVEESTGNPTVTEHNFRRVTSDVRTGDMDLTLIIGIACVSGVLLLILAFYGAAERKKEKKEAK